MSGFTGVVMIGIPGSGKTTFGREWMKFFIDRNIPIFTSPDADTWWSTFVAPGERMRELKERS